MENVIVLNVTKEPLHMVNINHAIKMLHRGIAVIEESEPGRKFGPHPYPRVLKLIRYVVTTWKYNKKPIWSKRRVLVRDKGLCAYCKGPANTIDHILPVSRYGASNWLNTISSCKPCNSKKSSKTPVEAGMELLFKPFVPSFEHVNRMLAAKYL